MSKINTPVVDVEDYLGLGETASASGSTRKIALIDEETRLKLFVSSVTVIGLESFKSADGTTSTNYKIGVGYTANRPQRYEDGEETGRYVSFFGKYTFSFHEKSAMATSGLLEALAVDTTKTNLGEFVGTILGKQVSAMISHRKYKNAKGVDCVAMDIEKLKAVKDPDDFTAALDKWEVPFFVAKQYGDRKIVTWKDVAARQPAKNVSFYAAGDEAPVAGKVVDLT